MYIDESGDHTYRKIVDLGTRYLGLTALVVLKQRYDADIQPALEALKRKHFKYDPDHPVILHASDIQKMKGPFGVLQDQARRELWADDIVAFYQGLPAQVFTVVIDKDAHKTRFAGVTLANPYTYSLEVLLNRIRGYLNLYGGPAEVVAESRGKVEDAQIQAAYVRLVTTGDERASGAEYRRVYPLPQLTMRRKDQNVAGLQIADLLASTQRVETAMLNGRPVANPPTAFQKRLNAAAAHMINKYGRYLLE